MSLPHLSVSPATGSRLLKHCGDFIQVRVELDQPAPGRCLLRTNTNQGDLRRADVVSHIENKSIRLDPGWHDIEMEQIEPGIFSASLPLLEVGHFGLKPYFLAPDEKIQWSEGGNIAINVEPSACRSRNAIYCAFVRQFGPNKDLATTPGDDEVTGLKALDTQGWTCIPPSGKFRDLIGELDHIFGTLGCDILHLLPINPTPTTYARMGRFGSPYAALDFTAVNPELAEFDLKATPLDQFLELVDAVHARQGRLILDIAINHTGWAAKLHETHPEWIKRNADGSIHQPGAWGVTWEDLTELDHSRTELWQYLAEVFLTWCERGVDGFRCDAGYMIPFPAWEYIVSKVRLRFPDTIFLLEGLGGPWDTTERLLDAANLNWAYSELFQNYDKDQISWYMGYSLAQSACRGLMVHYAETHDNSRLAARSPTWARMRTRLCALLSHNGAFGFTAGVEWLAAERIAVHRSSGLNWGAPRNLVADISRLNKLLHSHPAFHDGSTLQEVYNPSRQVISWLRRDQSGLHPLLVIINLDCNASQDFSLRCESFGASTGILRDLLGKRHFDLDEDGEISGVLAPGEALALGSASLVHACNEGALSAAEARLSAMRVLYGEGVDLKRLDCDAEGASLAADPATWLRQHQLAFCQWSFPGDLKRQTPWAPGACLLLASPFRFRAQLLGRRWESIEAGDGSHFVVVPPLPARRQLEFTRLQLENYEPEQIARYEAELLLCADGDKPFRGTLKDAAPVTVLGTNGRGGMMRIPLPWGSLVSRYDALLACNLSPDHPENRHIFWRRCRLYAAHRHHVYELGQAATESVAEEAGRLNLIFRIPAGLGRFARVRLQAWMLPGKNATAMRFDRLPARDEADLADDAEITLFARPDIEDRNFHNETKGGHGLEYAWEEAIAAGERDFLFSPARGRKLRLACDRGSFRREPEWAYNLHMPQEASRGLASQSDLYSPGIFALDFLGGENATIIGQALTDAEPALIDPASILPPPPIAKNDLESVLRAATAAYVVKRGDLKTVIAGYPWFLDWGRDTLICCRGLVAAGLLEEVRAILLQFARFEKDGTLPNMISGDDASNRDTSDAPLWLAVAASDYAKATGSDAIFAEDCGGRKFLEVLRSIADNYLSGTPNGIRVDSATGLVYSPSHFTWMDTNHPAGTPREGYPIEIQALWYATLDTLASRDDSSRWRPLADKVRASVLQLYWQGDLGHFSDCLHTQGRQPADFARADDALRCNQLFAITLGLVPADEPKARAIVAACERLLVPGAIRTLADQPVRFALPVYGNQGQLLNDPRAPFWPRYEGDEDTRRKPAYHNGTAWTWPFPSWCEALALTEGHRGRAIARSLLGSVRVLLDSGCLGQLPEIIDGAAPHRARGCDAQAWSVTESLRVLRILKEKK